MFGFSYNRRSNLARNCEFFVPQYDSSTASLTNQNDFHGLDNSQSDIESVSTGESDIEIPLTGYSQDNDGFLQEHVDPAWTFNGNISTILLEIAKTFYESNLSASTSKKIYELMVKLSHRNIILPSYSIFARETNPSDFISTKEYFLCSNQQRLVSRETICCSNDVGKLFTFDLKSSIEYIIAVNKEYLWPYQGPTKKCIGDFKFSKQYEKIWESVDNNGGLNLTLILNIDDASMVKSNKTTVTPISYVIAELPPHRRYLADNVMLAGVWWGPCKVNHDELWKKSLLDEIEILSQLGRVMVNGEQIPTIVKIGLIVMDSVAKPKSMNIVQFNGYHGCPYCTIPGKSMTTNRGGSVMTYPLLTNVQYQKKDHAFYLTKGLQATRDGHAHCMGVKGTSILTNHITFPDQVAIDYMHCWLEGVFKTMMSMKPFCEGNVVSKIDKLSSSVKLPHEFSRKFRKLSELTYWKAHECKTFLCYLLPLLKNILDAPCFILIMALSISLRLLLTDEISRENVYKAEELIRYFILAFQNKYSEREMKFNFHLLTHIPDQVRQQGCLVHSSAFVYENNIYRLKSSFHGSRGQINQIVKTYVIKKSINLSSRFMQITPQGLDVPLTSLCNSTILNLPTTIIEEPLKGHAMDIVLSRKLLRKYGSHNENIYEFYSRVKKGRIIFHSLRYSYRRDSSSYYFYYTDRMNARKYGKINLFIRVPANINNKGHDEILVYFQKMNVVDHHGLFVGLNAVRSSHLKSIVNIVKDTSLFNKLRLTEQSDLITLSDIHGKAIVINESEESNLYWGTPFESAYEHD